MWYLKVYPLVRTAYDSMPKFAGHPVRIVNSSRRLVYSICQRINRLSEIMDELNITWNQRFDAERNFEGLFDENHRLIV